MRTFFFTILVMLALPTGLKVLGCVIKTNSINDAMACYGHQFKACK